MKNSLAYQTNQLLLANKISVDKEELFFQIESHPSYPSLHAITGVLTHFDIENAAIEVPSTREILNQLPHAFLALCDYGQGKEFVVIQKKGYFIKAGYANGKKETLSGGQFLKKFSGVLVAVEKGAFCKDQKSKKSLAQKLLPIFPAFFFTMLFQIFNPAFSAMIHFILAMIGALISHILIQEENGIDTPIGNALCSGASGKKNCKTVVNSKGSKILGSLKLSTLSMFYFYTVAISGFIVILFQPNLSLHYLVSLAVTPIIFYSIYYQYFVVKKWCTLCLGIVFILAGLAAISFLNYSSVNIFINPKELFAIVTGILITALFLIFILPNDVLIADLKKTKIEFFKFKRNFQVFHSQLNRSRNYETAISDEAEIVFGKKNSKLDIILLTNPFCKFCKPTHQLVEDILQKYAKDVSITIRFNVHAANLENSGTQVALRLLEIFNKEGHEKCLNAMNEIYEKNNSEVWFGNWGKCKNPEFYINTLEKQNSWCSQNELNFTPAILINGKSYPQEYERTELIYFIEDLLIEFQQNIQRNDKINYNYA